MTKGFVFGKFFPFHKGHEAMIRFALQHCDVLTVLICASDSGTIPGNIRTGWIDQTFAGQENVQVSLFEYSESELSSTSVSSRNVSQQWSEVFKRLLPNHGLLVTSEPYGEYVAEYMGIRHMAFDMPKQLYPVSATAIRNDLPGYWHFLPDSVKPYFSTKIVILGTESTGKTVLKYWRMLLR